MPVTIDKSNFANIRSARRSIRRLFAEQGIDLSYRRHRALISFSFGYIRQFLHNAEQEQTDAQLVMGILTRFLKRPAVDVADLLAAARQPLVQQVGKVAASSNLIYLLGRKHSKKFAVVAGHKRSAAVCAERMRESLAEALVLRADDELSPASPTKRVRSGATHQGPHGTPYKPVMRRCTSSGHVTGMLLAEISPVKSRQLAFDKKEKGSTRRSLFPTLFKAKSEEAFCFTVTKQDIIERSGKKRPCSQKSVMDGKSAADIFEAMGIKIEDEFRRKYHWAHRQGWGLGGLQQKENLDPATAGSNYTTLFYIESVIRHMLVEQGVEEITVNGQVEYHPSYPDILPIKISYSFDLANGDVISKVIEPLNPRVPTIEEHEVAKAFVASTLSI